MAQIVMTIKRGPYTGTVVQDKNQYTAHVAYLDKEVRKTASFYDQDEAEFECGNLIDKISEEEREKLKNTPGKLTRRL